MMRRITHALLLMAVSVTGAAQAATTDRWAHTHDKTTPVYVLPFRTAPDNMEWTRPQMPGEVKAERFHDSAKCGTCHTKIYDQWKGSMMANAWNDPIFQAVYRNFLERSKTKDEQAETAMCTRCHTPAGYVADEPGRYHKGAVSAAAADGVSCDVCHSIGLTAGIGNAPFLFYVGDAAKGVPGTKYGPRKDSKSPFHEVKFSDLHTRSEMCGMCHDVAHARNSMSIESTYTEWRQSPYNTGDPATSIHCQDCHMRQDESHPATDMTELVNMPGIAADESKGPKRREHVWQHNFVGGNLATTAILGHNPQAGMAADRLRHAASLEAVDLQPMKKMGLYTLLLKVTNTGAGHYLPTGMTFVREMWLDVRVLDSKGAEIYSSGSLDQFGNIRPGAVIYKTVLGEGGKERKPTFFLPGATQVLSDKRIRPKGFSLEEYKFIVRDTATFPLKLEARLRYRSAPQWLVNDVLGEKAPALPVYDMAILKVDIPAR